MGAEWMQIDYRNEWAVQKKWWFGQNSWLNISQDFIGKYNERRVSHEYGEDIWSGLMKSSKRKKWAL